MQLGSGHTYDLVNLATDQRGRFTVHDLYNYKGQMIVYGTLAPHQVRVVRGVKSVKERPSCPVVLPNESGPTIAKFVDQLNGLPLAFRDGQDLVFLVNMQGLPGFWESSKMDRESLLDKSRKVIDLYHDWKRLGEVMPLWFRDLRMNARAGRGQNGNPA